MTHRCLCPGGAEAAGFDMVAAFPGLQLLRDITGCFGFFLPDLVKGFDRVVGGNHPLRHVPRLCRHHGSQRGHFPGE